MQKFIRVTVWNEFIHEKNDPQVRAIYPNGIHAAIAEFLAVEPDLQVQTATLEQPEHGLSAQVLEDTDVLIWWGHVAHDHVADHIVNRVYERIVSGTGFIALHSAHFSKIFRRLMGRSCALKWREAGELERIWVADPFHPIARGLDESFELKPAEMYGEPFDVPAPDELVLLSWFEGGEVFRSGCCWRRGRGRVFYFRPGHEAYPIYYNASAQKVILNAVRWACQGESPGT